MHFTSQLTVLFVVLAVGQTCLAENYPQFRGANSNAVSATPLPVNWSDAAGEQTNIRWKKPLEGEGWSQPIIWENRVYMTAAVPANPAKKNVARPESNGGGYGRDRNDLVNVLFQYQVVCLDAATGEQIWKKTR